MQFFVHFMCLLACFCSLAFAYPEISRNVRSDVSSLFFSPFRVVGKRNQFYGLHKKIHVDTRRDPYVIDYPAY